jgi:uncharacterized protein YaaN involved in tellurite resistance
MTDNTNALVLTPPAPVATVTPAQADEAVGIEPAARAAIETQANSYVDSLIGLDPNSTEFSSKVDAVHNLGDDEIRQAASVSNRFLERPVNAMNGDDKTKEVSKGLVDLRQTIEDLDPSKQGLLSKKKIFGLIPFGDSLRDYFDKYRSSQSHLDAIVNALYRGQDELRRDNAALDQERTRLWEVMGQLRQYAFMTETLDHTLSAKIAELETSNAEQADKLNKDVLFYVRQKHQDLLTQLAVSVQGYLALDLVKKNNTELIKGVDRATTTTISALRTAVIVSQALGNQKLVLDQITALNTTTSNMIESTSELLKNQSAEINKQASESTIDIDKIKIAFDNVYATMDAIDTYKLQALENMKTTVSVLSQRVEGAQKYLERVGSPEQSDKTGELSLPNANA